MRRPSRDTRHLTAEIDASGILPLDRMKLSAFYQTLASVTKHDGEADLPRIRTMWRFVRMHARSVSAVEPGCVSQNVPFFAEVYALMLRLLGAKDGPLKYGVAVRLCVSLAWRVAVHDDGPTG